MPERKASDPVAGAAESGKTAEGEAAPPTPRRRALLRWLTHSHVLRHMGLRARVTVTFAVGAFLVSALMACITYFTVRSSYLNESSTQVHQAFVNASIVQSTLRTSKSPVSGVLESVDASPGSHSILYTGGQWHATSFSVGQNAIPAQERELVLSGTAATQRFALNGTPQIVVGVPLPAVHSAYFEIYSLGELDSTLATLASVLAATALVTTVAGAAIGRWASGRALRPLAGITEAAVAIAGGQLGTRVEAGDDRDLQGLAAAFNTMATSQQARIEREARFTSDVSHELRSPLTTLTTSMDVLEGHRAELSLRAQRALALLDGDLRRFTRMVDDLLEISRFDAGSAELSLDEVNPAELVRQAVATTSPVGEDGNRVPVAFRVVVARGVENLRLHVDKRRFERIIANLVGNAAAYAGGVTQVVIRAGPTPQGGPPTTLRVLVDDAGPGILPADRSHLFERFYRGGRSGQREASEGTGLGLSLVAEHTRLHGGSVWIEDAPGGGARFVVELPLEPHPTDDDRTLAVVGPVTRSGPGQGRGRQDRRTSEQPARPGEAEGAPPEGAPATPAATGTTPDGAPSGARTSGEPQPEPQPAEHPTAAGPGKGRP